MLTTPLADLRDKKASAKLAADCMFLQALFTTILADLRDKKSSAKSAADCMHCHTAA